MKRLLLGIFLIAAATSCSTTNVEEWIETTPSATWQEKDVKAISKSDQSTPDATVSTSNAAQVIDGFGGCFNELGWTSLSLLSEEDRNAVLDELFTPGKGACLSICRMPVGANDFSRDWYSYDETPGDFEMKNFSIDNDKETLIPYIKEALKRNPDMKLWASPWSPPVWMKDNKHYACRPIDKAYFKNVKDTGMKPEQERKEGDDMFIQEDSYLKAYALYFTKFIEAYRNEGIEIFMVMPQNEFNSCQNFPSCLWKAGSLANFMGKYLGPAMEKLGVELMFGTMERPNTAMVDTVMNDPDCQKYVKGAAFQWAGKDALPYAQEKYPQLKLVMSEQECGDGKNDWDGCLHSWDLMKHYFKFGVSIYDYWNMSLTDGGLGRWGWRQNSFISVNPDTRKYSFNNEYYLFKHASHFVKQGTKYLPVEGVYDDMMAFQNPGGEIVLIMHNGEDADAEKTICVNGKNLLVPMSPDSFNTIVVKL